MYGYCDRVWWWWWRRTFASSRWHIHFFCVLVCLWLKCETFFGDMSLCPLICVHLFCTMFTIRLSVCLGNNIYMHRPQPWPRIHSHRIQSSQSTWNNRKRIWYLHSYLIYLIYNFIQRNTKVNNVSSFCFTSRLYFVRSLICGSCFVIWSFSSTF